jgi:hypothetical protein
LEREEEEQGRQWWSRDLEWCVTFALLIDTSNLSIGIPGPETTINNGHLSSPEYSYNGAIPVANHLGSPINGFGAHSAAPPTAQLNLNGTSRLNRFGHLGPETAIQSFYHYFYNSHPFCLPEPRLLELFKDRQAPLLEYAVQFLGASFIPSMPADMYKEALNRHISNGNYPRDAFSVQALMLFGIGLHAHNEVPRAAQIFNIAQALTLEIGLHRMEFALMHGGGDPQLEESWRRTWWSMFTVNGMMTAVNPGVQFKLKDIVTDVPLPCENDQYFSGVSTHLPLTLGNISFPSVSSGRYLEPRRSMDGGPTNYYTPTTSTLISNC